MGKQISWFVWNIPKRFIGTGVVERTFPHAKKQLQLQICLTGIGSHACICKRSQVIPFGIFLRFYSHFTCILYLYLNFLLIFFMEKYLIINLFQVTLAFSIPGEKIRKTSRTYLVPWNELTVILAATCQIKIKQNWENFDSQIRNYQFRTKYWKVFPFTVTNI